MYNVCLYILYIIFHKKRELLIFPSCGSALWHSTGGQWGVGMQENCFIRENKEKQDSETLEFSFKGPDA